jgi:hypothetical protein
MPELPIMNACGKVSRGPWTEAGFDARGYPVTGADAATLARLDRFAAIVLRRGRGGEIAFEAAEAAPNCPMALAAAAAGHLLADTRAGVTAARPLLVRAATLRATARESLYIAALTAMAEDRPMAASLLFLELGRQAPRDLFAGYVGQLHCLNHGHFEIMLGLARLLADANPADGFALGMLSFALDQNSMPGPAEAAGLAALEADGRIAWVHHALAHVYQDQGRIEDGLALLDAHAGDWAECGSSMYTHNWWHAMLLRLEAGAAGDVLAAYDEHIADGIAQSTSSFVNAVSLLSRLGSASMSCLSSTSITPWRWPRPGGVLRLPSCAAAPPAMAPRLGPRSSISGRRSARR